ncbi:ABC transporter substrate-binding protein [Deinococcus cellulosilyticus]|uniref:ABC transporter substrate-binding protein n=1 Tax=Deinococcus cellulosilyticus (strain DSM 18568 / NBRC 106333 / KACC 11606 / 5516J-15) TaxID=1223518 RepID=A0A511N6W9_DEIC1|nr:iron-siderophore ABC transporter substrate-binding protein [Deinococcus cellulosilyticus]GEM48594.1 ABC transporter substrate-binding protein [Deinococcus cellulosilyticus NBRC 106333 = KACC 11606]
MNLKPLLPTFLALFSGTVSAVNIKHEVGTTSVKPTPKRIVALGPHALDLLLSLGIQPVGYGEATQLGINNFGEPLKQIKYLGKWVTGTPVNVGDRFNPSLEVLMALKTDLIVGENFASAAYPQLERIAPTLLFKGTGRNDWKKTLPLLALAVGKQKEAAQTLNSYRKYVDQARTQLKPLVKNKKFLLVWNSGFAVNTTFTVFTADDYAGGVLEDLGMKVLSAGGPQKVLSLEGLAAIKADAVLVLAAGKSTPEAAREDWYGHPLLQSLPVSKQKQVYFFDYHPFARIRGPLAARLMVDQLQQALKTGCTVHC